MNLLDYLRRTWKWQALSFLLMILTTVIAHTYLMPRLFPSFSDTAAGVHMSHASLDLNQRDAAVIIQFTNTHDEDIELDIKSTMGIERIPLSDLNLGSTSYRLDAPTTIRIPARASTPPISCTLSDKKQHPAASRDIGQQLAASPKIQQVDYTIQSCRLGGKLHDDGTLYTYRCPLSPAPPSNPHQR